MEFEVTRHAMVVRHGCDDGRSFGSSGRAQLKILNQPDNEAGYALLEASHPVGEPRIRDHIHIRHEETFVVLEGEYEVRLGDDIIVAAAGDFVFVPRGTPHTYRNASSAPAKILNLISPADGVKLLAELGELVDSDVQDEVVAEIHTRHGALLASPLPNW